MLKNKGLEKNVQDAFKMEPLLNKAESRVNAKPGSNLKKFMLIASLAGVGLFFSGCATRYVANEPIYLEYNRPPQPSNANIWVNSDWAYNRQNHAYVQTKGYWAQPSRNRTFVPGHWEASPRGNYWVSGRWQRNR